MLLALYLALETPARLAEMDARITAALAGLEAAVEDDVARNDSQLVSIETKGCGSRFVTKAGEINVNWSAAQQVGMSDGFIFVSAPPAQFAIVADVEKEDQWTKLKALDAALEELAARCMAQEIRPIRQEPETEGTQTP